MNTETVSMIKNGVLQVALLGAVVALMYTGKLDSSVANPILTLIVGAIFGANIPSKKG